MRINGTAQHEQPASRAVGPALRGATGSGLRARSTAYALFSELTRSPFRPDGSVIALPPADLPELLAELGRELPFALDAFALADAAAGLCETDGAALAAEYSSLFEVGQPGPPVAIRESLMQGDGRQVLEEVVRYYDFFGYRLDAIEQWCPDHLSIELEFLHLLALRHDAGDRDDPQHLLASRDFLCRHLLAWLPAAAATVRERSPGSWWQLLWDCLHRYLESDRLWLTTALEGH